jgi:putative SOS response-associated peptidase YedK
MCNAYNTAKKPDQLRIQIGNKTKLIRRTDQAPVLLGSGEVVLMRWGFQRKNLGVVNNTRSDNLESPMWREAVEKRRCLIPVASYYEWTGPKGNKQTHLFRSPENEWLWMAGIWEESSEHGRCFSMLTTEANPLVAPIHHRMPALLTKTEREDYLAGEMTIFRPAPEMLVTEPAANPLVKRPSGPVQGDLFS